MSDAIERLAVIADIGDSIDVTVRQMAARSRDVAYAGLAVVLEGGRLAGVVTDGDIRRAYAAETDWSQPISEIMTRDPITLPADMPIEDMVPEIYRRSHGADHITADAVRHIMVTDEDGRLATIHDFLDLLRDQDKRNRNVVVFGMGYVGLTLAVSLANNGHMVTGIDIDPTLVKNLNDGVSHIHERGLTEMLRVVLRKGNFEVRETLDQHRRGIYIIAVGTPLDAEGKPDFTALKSVAKTIGARLKHGEQIMLRSTVPAGTTRGLVLPILEAESGLIAGKDFHLAFAPERTLAGQALVELRTLPQIVGGLTASCTNKAATFWASLTPSVVQVENIEAAEIVKLANNTFRDLSFAFANELALLSDEYNLDAFDVIAAANHGYTRNPIPRPSPGVGGYCLTKDPILLCSSFDGSEPLLNLGNAGRQVNEKTAAYPIEVVHRFARRLGREIGEVKVLIMGLAFKGEPETNDIRGSVSLDVARSLAAAGAKVSVWDAVIGEEQVGALGFEAAPDADAAVSVADAVLILNNHRNNVRAGFTDGTPQEAPKLIFDGWSLLNRAEIEAVPNRLYATMGYLTPGSG